MLIHRPTHPCTEVDKAQGTCLSSRHCYVSTTLPFSLLQRFDTGHYLNACQGTDCCKPKLSAQAVLMYNLCTALGYRHYGVVPMTTPSSFAKKETPRQRSFLVRGIECEHLGSEQGQ